MDPITSAIVAALGQLGADVIKNAYDALKAAIAEKCGVDSDVTEAIHNLEKKPESTGRKETLREEVEATVLEGDSEILELVQTLLEEIKNLDTSNDISHSSTVIAQEAGDNATQIGQVSGDVSIKR
jgi:hypothetical protein